MWAKLVEAPVPTSAVAPGQCHNTAGRPYLDKDRRLCVDANGHGGFSPEPARALSPKLPRLEDLRETADAARICGPWPAPRGGVMQPPIIAPAGAKPAGREVCDPYWNINVNGRPSIAKEHPEQGNLIETRRRHQFGGMVEALRQGAHTPNRWVWWVMFLAVIIVVATIIKIKTD